jgi:hypothetical protein
MRANNKRLPRTTILQVAFFLALMGAVRAGAETLQSDALSLADLFNIQVVTASNSAEPIYEAPNVMYVYPNDVLRHRGLRDLKDVFQVTPGLGVQHKDLMYVGQVRGIAGNDNEKIALMINGHVVNNVAEPDFFNGGSYPLDFVDRVEIIVGPGGVFYGGEPLCAIVNLITKQKSDEAELIGSIGGGAQELTGDRTLSFMTGKQIGNDASFFASGSYYQKSGHDAWRENSSNTRDATLSEYPDVTGKILPSYQMFFGGTIGDWTSQFYSVNSQIPELHLIGFRAAEDGRRTDNVISGQIENKRKWSENVSSDFKFSGDYKRYVRGIYSVGKDSGNYDNYDLSQSNYGIDLEVSHTIPDRNFFQVGIQWKVSQDRQNYDLTANPDDPYGFTHTATIVVMDSTGKLDTGTATLSSETAKFLIKPGNTYAGGAYISDKFTINAWIKLVAALRLDRNTILDNPSENRPFFDMDLLYLAPRAALLVNPIDKLHLKLMYNVANRLDISPWSSPMNAIWGKGNAGAPDWATANPTASVPEKLTSYEAQAVYFLSDWKLQVNYWHQNLKDFISWFSPFTNVGDFSGDGVEYEIAGPVFPGVAVWTNGSWCSNDFNVTAKPTEGGEGSSNLTQFQLPANPEGQVLSVPEFTANLGLDIAPMADLFVNPSVRYFTKQPMAVPVGSDMNYGYADNMFYFDLTATYENIRIGNVRFGVQASVKNILDNTDLVSTQWLADAVHPEGRTWEVRISSKF